MIPFKVCGCCKREYTEAEFLALEKPRGGEFGSGLRFRQCGCGSTLALPFGPQETDEDEMRRDATLMEDA